MEYTIVVRYSIRELVAEVERMINEGWMPNGNLVAVRDNIGNMEYLQPMVRYTDGYTFTLKPDTDYSSTPATP